MPTISMLIQMLIYLSLDMMTNEDMREFSDMLQSLTCLEQINLSLDMLYLFYNPCLFFLGVILEIRN